MRIVIMLSFLFLAILVLKKPHKFLAFAERLVRQPYVILEGIFSIQKRCEKVLWRAQC